MTGNQGSGKPAAVQIERSVTIKVLPYEDGSGHRYEVEGRGSHVTVRQHDGVVDFVTEAEWTLVRQAVDDAFALVAGKPGPRRRGAKKDAGT